MNEGPGGIREKMERVEESEASPTEKNKTYQQVAAEVAQAQKQLERTAADDAALEDIKKRLGMQDELKELAGKASDNILENKKAQKLLELERGLRTQSKTLAETALVFGNEIGRRDKSGMDPFIDARAFSAIRGGFQAIREYGEKEAGSLEDLANAINLLASGLEQLGKTRNRGAAREDMQSLNTLSYGARGIYEASQNMRNFVSEGNEALGRALTHLQNASDQAYQFTGRLRQIMRN